MFGHTLQPQTINALERQTGFTYEELTSLDTEELEIRIEKRIGKKLTSFYGDEVLTPRGSVYLSLNRITTEEEVDRILEAI